MKVVRGVVGNWIFNDKNNITICDIAEISHKKIKCKDKNKE